MKSSVYVNCLVVLFGFRCCLSGQELPLSLQDQLRADLLKSVESGAIEGAAHLVAVRGKTAYAEVAGFRADGHQPPFDVPQDIAFRTGAIISEGTRMSAEVFAPQQPNSEKLPTIVMSHGWGGTAVSLRSDAIVFARGGFLVVVFDYRGWGSSDSRLIAVGQPIMKEHLK